MQIEQEEALKRIKTERLLNFCFQLQKLYNAKKNFIKCRIGRFDKPEETELLFKLQKLIQRVTASKE